MEGENIDEIDRAIIELDQELPDEYLIYAAVVPGYGRMLEYREVDSRTERTHQTAIQGP